MLSTGGMRAWLNLRYVAKRGAAFEQGLKACGFEVVVGLPVDAGPGDVFVTWNRIGQADDAARRFKGAVIVAENAAWGNEFLGGQWHSLARDFHNTAGMFPVGEPQRWGSLGVDLVPWRTSGETVVLPQRGIGPRGVAMPHGWTSNGRVRKHPGNVKNPPLEQDLANCGRVVTWGSGAAIKALMWGIPVESHMPNWIGEQDNTDAGRLAMFRRLAWAQWTLDEIASGEPFKRLL